MKKLLSGLLLICSLTAGATWNNNGYYRVKNYGSGRWAAMVDSVGEVDLTAGNADLHALFLTKDSEQIMADPGSIVYISHLSGNYYDLSAQGTSFESLVHHNISIGADGKADDQTLYRIYGSYNGVTRYIADGNILTTDVEGWATINPVNNANFMKWELLPVDVQSNNYFGTVPTVAANGNQYTTLFTSFAYKPYSEGVKAFYIARVGFGMAEMVEIEGAVPPGNPVIIQCAGNNVSNNRLEIMESQEDLPSNALKGAYFNYEAFKVDNYVAYDPETMRVLGVCSDGSLGFVVKDIKSIPANSAYLVVPAGSAPEFKCVSSDVFEDNIPEAPDAFYYGNSVQIFPQDDYNYTGSLSIPAPEGNNKDVMIQFSSSSTGAEQYIIGPYSNTNVNLNLSGETSTPFAFGSKGYWVLPNWEGGEVAVNINVLYQSVTFTTKSAGVESIGASAKNLSLSGNTIYSETSAEIKVLNLSGQVVAKGYGNSLDISNLPKGIYVATANGETLKVVR